MTKAETVEIEGVRFAYSASGEGEPVVLVHANISDIRSWSTMLPLLVPSFRVVAYSRRHAWPNEPIAEGADDPWSRHVDDLARLIEKLGIGRAHVVGNSTGGFLALLLARQRSDLVRSLVLEEPPVLPLFLSRLPPNPLELLRLACRSPGAAFAIAKFGATTMGPVTAAFQRGDDDEAAKLFVRGVLGSEFAAKVSEERWEQIRANLKPHRAVLLGSGLPSFSEEDARAIRCPTLILRGELTPSFQQHINRRLAELIPGAEERVIPRASHLMHEDNPEGTASAIKAFLQTRPVKA